MKFALIGAELKGLDVHSNYERTTELRNALLQKGLSFEGVQNISSGKSSQLFLVTTSDLASIVSLAKAFSQKAVLISDEDYNMERVSVKNSDRHFLGKLTATTKADAKLSKFHLTFQEDGKQYYFVTNKGIICDKTARRTDSSTY